jgi:hypothetical protein
MTGAVLGDVAAELAAAALALARRFSAGATLWCWSPGSPEHAQHVAVEFVHPVIMGTRALPARAVLEPDAGEALRPVVRAGDVLLVVGTGAAHVGPTLGRAAAWGLTTIWVGVGNRPLGRAADHLLWLGDDEAARDDGRLVLGYHLLWELTHVCFEHPGLLTETPVTGAVCTTCADEGRLGEVLRAEEDDAEVRTAAGVERISTLMVGPVAAGDLVLVHAGTAITRVAL